jgi:hypothetical protein
MSITDRNGQSDNRKAVQIIDIVPEIRDFRQRESHLACQRFDGGALILDGLNAANLEFAGAHGNHRVRFSRDDATRNTQAIELS